MQKMSYERVSSPYDVMDDFACIGTGSANELIGNVHFYNIVKIIPEICQNHYGMQQFQMLHLLLMLEKSAMKLADFIQNTRIVKQIKISQCCKSG